MTHGWLVAASVVVLGCGTGPASTPPRATASRTVSRDRIDHASMITRGHPASDQEWQAWRAQGFDLGAIVDELVADPFLSDQVGPITLFRNNLIRPARVLTMLPWVLRTARIGAREVFYLDKPCAPAQVVQVAPWWDVDHPVAVCSTAVRATVWNRRMQNGTLAECDRRDMSPVEDPTSPCGCGPSLVRCGLPEHIEVLQAAAQDEVSATTAYVIRNNTSLAQLFTMNETWRGRMAELFYLRGVVQSERIADPEPLFRSVDGWPDTGKLAPRRESEPGQHAGVLTTPHFTHHIFDPRQRMRIHFEGLWCAGESAPGALPEDMLALHTPDMSILNHGWQELAARPVCTHCHARLDYGMQFFRGYPSPNGVASHYLLGGSPAARGPLYGMGIDDPRGEGELTPRGFAELATSQPEFARCMARDVAELVFGPQTTSETIERLAASAAPTQLRFRELMRLTLLEFLRCEECGHDANAATRRRGRRAPTLAALLDEHCTACHHDGAKIPSFERAIDRQLSARIVDQVVFGAMPPTGALPIMVRGEFLAAAGPPSRSAAGVFLDEYANPAATLPLLIARESARQTVGQHARADELNSIEIALSGRDNVFTPNFAAFTAVEAYTICDAVAGPRADCVQATLDRMWGPAAGIHPRRPR